MSRTFAIGDVHGDLDALRTLVARLPLVAERDTIVFLGDYIDRGPHSKEVVELVRALDRDVRCKVVCLRGNHEDAWLRVIARGWPEFIMPGGNGCLETLRSYEGKPAVRDGELPSREDAKKMLEGSFFPPDHVEWMKSLPFFYEDEHAIYVHAGLVEAKNGSFVHPRDADNPVKMLWTRTERFFRDYRGKTIVVGHTVTEALPPELSNHTPADPTDMWAGPAVIAIDTGAGKGGFLTCVELPSRRVYDSR